MKTTRRPQSNVARSYSGEPIRYLTLYAVSRRFGGPEEGGWWYDDFRPVTTWRLRRTVNKRHLAKLMDLMLTRHGWRNEHNRDSVLGGEDAIVRAEGTRHEYRTRSRPRYE
jgi:hypothetical protein